VTKILFLSIKKFDFFQGIAANNGPAKGKCYCTGGCELSWLLLTCKCKTPDCKCGPSV
jgi:hypothetical protein